MLLIFANVVIAVSLLAAGGGYIYIQYRLDQIHRTAIQGLAPTAAKPYVRPAADRIRAKKGAVVLPKKSPVLASYPKEAFTLLLIGTDSRAGLTPQEQSQFNSSSDPVVGQRSDTIMLMRVDPANRRLNILSIPRDLWVQIQGGSYSGSYEKINAAFNNGASDTVATITDDLGIAINHVVEVNFNAFMQIDQAVGGVRVYFPTPARDAYSGLDIPAAGCYTLDGAQALEFARARHYTYYQDGYWQQEGLSDIARIDRQQMFVKKLVTKAKGLGLSDPLAMNNLVAGITTNLTVDKGFGNGLIEKLAERFRNLDAAAIPTATYPSYLGWTDGQSVLFREPAADEAAVAAFLDTSLPATQPAPGVAATTTTVGASPRVTLTTLPRRTTQTVNPADVSVEVLNGSGVSGQGAQVSGLLGQDGFVVPYDANADNFDHLSSVILFAPSDQAGAELLKTVVKGRAVLEPDPTMTPGRIELITGRDLTGIRPLHGPSKVTYLTTPATTTSTTTTTAPPTTTVPGGSAPASTAGYQLPGWVPSDAAAQAACTN
jgi:LCP family protein required for cell wall assembly